MTRAALPRRIVVTAAPSTRRPTEVSRIDADGSVDRLTHDGWINVSRDPRQMVVLPTEVMS